MPLFEIILTLCGAICFALCTGLILIRIFLIVVTVHGQSMIPTLEHEDRVLVLRCFRSPGIRKGQIVLLWQAHPDEQGVSLPVSYQIKRVTALAEETYVSSMPPLWDHEHVFRQQSENTRATYVWSIPQKHIFVCGDNSEQSIDSRSWGPLPLQNVRGIVLMKLAHKPLSSSAQKRTTFLSESPPGQVTL